MLIETKSINIKSGYSLKRAFWKKVKTSFMSFEENDLNLTKTVPLFVNFSKLFFSERVNCTIKTKSLLVSLMKNTDG